MHPHSTESVQNTQSTQSSQVINTFITSQNNVGSIPLHGSVRSLGIRTLIVSSDLSTSVYQKLAKQFQLTHYVPNMNMNGYDAMFIDCRGVEINCPLESVSEQPIITLALVNENSYQSDDSANNNSNLELTTEAELDSAVLKLRLDACVRKNRKPANADNSVTNFVKDNAYEILQAFIKNSTDWIVVKDLNNRFIMVSDRFLKTENKSEQEIIGKNDLEIGTSPELVLGNAEKNWKGYWQLDKEVIASGKSSYIEQMIIHENSLQQVREQVAKIPLLNASGNIIGLMVFITQVHSSKFNGEKISEFASRCNTSISPLIGKLDSERSKAVASSQKSKSAFKRKNNFIATASHDLRQPLQAIGLFIESLEHQITDKNQRSTLKKMKQSSNDLTELLNSILDISKLDADAVLASKSHFCIAPLLKSLEDEFETEALRKSLKLHVTSTNSFIFTDSLLLVRILRNLLSNAVKYTQTGNVNLTTEIDGDSLLIHIKDSGPGIPKEQYMAIFDEYNQLDDQSSQPNFGMGLGLSIVKRLTDLLDLDISLESQLGHGTRFTLTVPLGVESSSVADSKNEIKLEPIESYKLLVVEDNPTVLDATQEMLTSMNCEAYPANDIPEALEIIKELDELPDLLIVDYQLANGVTGDTAIEKICEAANEKLPAIIVTGNTNSGVFREATKAAYRVLNKPVNPDGLLKTIDSAIKEHRESLIEF